METTPAKRLSARIVHDLRNPLTAIRANIEFARGARSAHDAGVALDDALEACDAMSRMLLDLADVGRGEAGTLSLNWEMVDLCTIVRDVARSAQRRVEGSRTLKPVLPEHGRPDTRLNGDGALLTRVVDILIHEAVRHTARGGTIVVELIAERGRLVVRVHDEGPTIPVELRARIFDKHAQADPGVSAVRPGLGLGLPLCRVAAEAHGGQVWIEDGVVRGNIVCMALAR